jgi:hypothetical protein
MRLARYALLSLASVCALGSAWLGCSSFRGQDSSTGDSDASAPGDGDAPFDGAGGVTDGGADAQSPTGKDSGAPDIDTLPCPGGTPVLVDDMKNQNNWELLPPPFLCLPTVEFGFLLGATFDCDAMNGGYLVLASKDAIPDTRAVIAVQFKVLDDTDSGAIPKHIFAQLLGVLGSAPDAGIGTNLSFVYDQGSQKSVRVHGEGGQLVALWSGVSNATSHILRISLPPVGTVQSSDPVTVALDGDGPKNIALQQRNSGKLQIGPYLQADGHVKDRFGAVRIWSCP